MHIPTEAKLPNILMGFVRWKQNKGQRQHSRKRPSSNLLGITSNVTTSVKHAGNGPNSNRCRCKLGVFERGQQSPRTEYIRDELDLGLVEASRQVNVWDGLQRVLVSS